LMDLSAASNAIPLIVAIVAAAMAFGAIALVLRRQQPELLEETAGLTLLRGYKWSELAHLLLQSLRRRGYESAESERIPGDGGFDLLVQRGSDRYLVQCKQGAHLVGAADVRNLLALMPSHDASGAILVTTGRFDADALQAAKSRPVQLLDGFSLWREVKPILPAQALHQIERSIAARERFFTIMKGAGAALAAAVTYVAATVWMRPPAPVVGQDSARAAITVSPPPSVTPAQAPSPTAPRPAASSPVPATAPSAAAPAPAPSAAPPPQATATTAAPSSAPVPAVLPPPAAAPAPKPAKSSAALPELTQAQEQERRKAALADVRAVVGVESTDWSTKSTLAVALRAGNEERVDSLVAAVCAAVVAFEELRYTRLQVTDSLATSEADKRVRWRQCQ
jgi:hypothetical protein